MNIELDSHRNKLIRVEIVLGIATFAILPFNLMAGVLGENLVVPEAITGSVRQLFGVNLAAALASVTIFAGLMCYLRYRRLL